MTDTRTAATREKLFAAAVELISEQGFHATTVDEIAERAGVAKGTVYYNFPSKTRFFEALLEHGVGILTAALRRAVDEAGPSLAARLPALQWALLESIDDNPAFARVVVAEIFRTNREWADSLRAVREQSVGVIAEVLRDGVRAGEIPADTDVSVAASALFGMTLVVALDWKAFQPERSISDVHRTLARLLSARGLH